MKRSFIASGLAVVALAGAASADVVSTTVSVPAGGIGGASIGLAAGARYTFFNFGTNDDTVMRMLDPGLTEVVSDDDGGPALNSGFNYVAAAGGTHTLQISGYPDFTFTGNPGAAFTTQLVGCNGPTGAESGSNNTYLTADAAIFGTAGFAMSGSVTPGDVDFFAFNGAAGEAVGAFLDTAFDSLLALFDSSGLQLVVDDDGGPGAASSAQFILPSAGTYYWAVTAYPDTGFTGNHTGGGDYLLIAANGTAIPAPGVAAALGLGGLLAAKRRRR